MRRSLFYGWTAAIALFAFAAFAAVWLIVSYTLDDAGRSVARRGVDTDLTALTDIYESGGRAELARRIEDRLAFAGDAAVPVHYRLEDPRARAMIAGDLPAMPKLDPARSAAGAVELSGGREGFGRATMLDRDLQLVVVHETGPWEAAAANVRRTVALAGLGIVLIAVVAGALAAWRLRGRIERVNAGFAAIEGGALDTRLPTRGKGDEIDRLVGHANRMIDRLARAIRAHRDISDHTAHEIRTPLTHLGLRLHSILEDGDFPADSAIPGVIVQARDDIAEVTAVLDSLLDISHSEAHRDEYRALPRVDFSALVRNLAEIYLEHAGETGIAMHADVAERIVIPGDAMQLTRMVSNLVDNAFKYRAAEGAEIFLRLKPGPVLTVRDNGPGVPTELRERIFERFAREGHAGVRGHGLGLSLARAVAERHGLRLCLIEAEGPGAEFRVERKQDES